MTIKNAIKKAKDELQDSCDSPQFEAELLLAYTLKKDRLYFHINDNKEIETDEYFELIKRRANNEPYEYIINSASFYDIDLFVADGVLIPRPETEILIDEVSKIILKENINYIVEIGIGSGAISIVLARKFPNLKIVATDISDKAILIARKNIKSFGLEDRIKVIKSNLIDNIADIPQLIVSNPPYIAKDFLLESNVVDYEPHTALFGGEIGDELLIKIINDTKEKSIKYLACEMGYDQKDSITNHLNKIEAKSYNFYKDLAGFDRGFLVEI
ncbi:Protein-N(5)-glutamine methyltransferase PrmC, methylates polypeptide chain release factors RF1 and RF2 [hydrothermal vent metagenome]|uniref:peptide chain release factor N(5)-glutamine methyltransferase n=1 Tax=hydrothermal vent metagenome TaxID=652676 RepID=A0A1W1C6L2_9ZZZZ